MEMKKEKILNSLFLGVFAFYVLVVLYIVLFFRTGSFEYQGVNLIPFKSIKEGLNVHDGISYHLVDLQVWGNVLMFVPAGIFAMAFSKKEHFLTAFFEILSVSILIEIVQFIFHKGALDIDDVILNGLGGFLGIIFYFILRKIFKTKEKTKAVMTWLAVVVGGLFVILGLTLFLANL